MTAISWKSPVSDNWSVAADWSTDSVPGNGDDATLGGTSGYTVAITSPFTTVNSIAIPSGSVTLTIEDVEATLTTGDITNAGAIDIDNNGTGGSDLTIGGTLGNTHELQIGDGGISIATTVSAQALSNTGQIDIEGGPTVQAALDIAAAAPTAWTGTLNISGDGLLEFGGTGNIATIASGANINLYGSSAIVAAGGSGTTSDSALTQLAVISGQLQLRDGATLTTAGGLSNSNYLLIDNGGGGGGGLTVGGTLANSADVQIGDNAVAATVSAQGLNNTGQIQIEGGTTAQALLTIAAAAPASWTGSVDISDDGALVFGGSGGISTIASGGNINLYGSRAVVAVNNPGTAGDSALTGLAAIAGELQLQNGASLTTSVGLNNSNYLLVNNGGGGGSSLTIGGTLTNSGDVQAGNNSLATTISAQGLINTGQLNIEGGTTAQALVTIAAAAPTSWTGTANISGEGVLDFGGSNGISTIASGGAIDLYGSQAVIALSALGATSDTALTGLAVISGQLQLQNGASLTTTGGLTNSNYLLVNNGGGGGAGLTVTGTLTNSGDVQVGDNALTTTVSAQGLANTGQLNIDGGTTLQTLLTIAATAPTSWTGTVNISGDGALDFGGSNGIATIASGANINLYGPAAAIALNGGVNALDGLTSISGQLQLQDGASLSTTGGLSNANYLLVNNGGSGGSGLSVAGTLTNSGDVQVGDNSQAATISAQGLSNGGQIDIDGGTTAQALMTIAAAAPADWTGTVNISNDGKLEFGGTSGIATIASGANINLYGSAAAIALNGGTNALGGLSVIAGALQLQDGAALSTSGGLTNSNHLEINNGGSGGSSLTVAGTLTNGGFIQIGDNSAATTVSAQGLSNTGGIDIDGGTTVQALLTIAAAAPSVWTGTANINNDGTLEFGGTSGIATIASNANIDLSGSRSAIGDAGSPNALGGLAAIAGELQLRNGASLTTAGALNNSDFLEVDNSGGGGSSLTVGGVLTNSNDVQVGSGGLSSSATLDARGLLNTGQIAIQGNSAANRGVLLVTGGATNDGVINLYGFAQLDIGGTLSPTSTAKIVIGANAELELGAAASGSVVFNGTGADLKLDAPAGFTGTIDGFTPGETIDLANTTATLAAVSGGTLTVGLSGGGTLAWAQPGDFTGENVVVTQEGGDSDLSLVAGSDIPPALTVPGTLLADATEARSIPGVSVSDSASAGLGETITVTLTDTLGQLSANTNVGGGGGTITGSGGTTLTIAGLLAQVNADLTTLTYLAPISGGDTIDVNANDGRGGESPQATVAVDVVVPTPPVINAPSSAIVTAGTALSLGTFSVTDADNGPMSLTLSDTTGTLSASQSGAGTVTGSGTDDLILSGDPADINAELATLAYFGASPGVDYNATAQDTVSLVATEAGKSSTQTTAVTIDQMPFTNPTLTVPSSAVLIPGVPTDIPGISVSDPYAAFTGELLDVTFMSTDGNTTFTLTGGTGGTITGQGTGTISIVGSLQQINSWFGDGLNGDSNGSSGTSGASGTASPSGGAPPSTGFNPATNLGLINGLSNGYGGGGKGGGDVGPPPGGSSSSSGGSGSSGAYSHDGGHPTLVTFDGVAYGFNPEGEFILTKSTVPGNTFEIEARYAPWDNSTSGSTTTAAAAQIGSDRVTFQTGRANLVWVDGAPTSLSTSNAVLPLADGELVELSPTSFQLTWNTGQQLTVYESFEFTGPYLDLSEYLPPNMPAGSVEGLLGDLEGAADTFALPNGTVLPQPLSTADLYNVFGAAWRLPAGTQGLFDYPTGENTDNFTDPNFPFDTVSVSDFPAAAVNQAASLVAAAGITNTALINAAELNYLVTGDPAMIQSVANAANEGANPTSADVTPPPAPPPLTGINSTSTLVTENNSASTAVTFTIYLTGTVNAAVTVDYAVVSPLATDLAAAAFGGVLPSGTVTIAAGQISTQVTIDLPAGGLGTEPTATMQVEISNPTGYAGIAVVSPTAETTIANYQPEPGAPAAASVGLFSNDATFQQNGSAYTLALGTIVQGETRAWSLSIANTATAPADGLGGYFVNSATAPITLDATGLPLINAGQSYTGENLTPVTSSTGVFSDTVTFDPEDLNASGYAQLLAAQTLTVTDTVEAPAIATINSATTIAFGDSRVGGTLSAGVDIGNTATSPAANLDATSDVETGGAVTNGSFLRPGTRRNRSGQRRGRDRHQFGRRQKRHRHVEFRVGRGQRQHRAVAEPANHRVGHGLSGSSGIDPGDHRSHWRCRKQNAVDQQQRYR